MHTKEMILNGLKELHDEYDPHIQNYNYRGSMEKIPSFTVKQIAEKIGRTPATTRKWCNVLYDELKLKRGYKRSYFSNEPMTYIYHLYDAKPVKLIPCRC